MKILLYIDTLTYLHSENHFQCICKSVTPSALPVGLNWRLTAMGDVPATLLHKPLAVRLNRLTSARHSFLQAPLTITLFAL